MRNGWTGIDARYEVMHMTRDERKTNVGASLLAKRSVSQLVR